MRAVFEMEMPESCSVCRLIQTIGNTHNCLLSVLLPADPHLTTVPVLRDIWINASEFTKSRAPNCPLKPSPECNEAALTKDGKCVGFQKSHCLVGGVWYE
jgi:hypothetical protein